MAGCIGAQRGDGWDGIERVVLRRVGGALEHVQHALQQGNSNKFCSDAVEGIYLEGSIRTKACALVRTEREGREGKYHR